MAKLLSIRQKEKEYVLKVFDNEKNESPAKVIFKRFPLADENFPYADEKSVLESFQDFDNSREARENLIKSIIDTIISNIAANRIDYKTFIKECVDRFDNLEYGGKAIKTVNDFFSLPGEAVYKIARDCYFYSRTEDEFSFDTKKN
jgi:predicted enzyme involved in methoxymalonyl-ACP biosynthesis